jgi:hypothetical protein
VRWRLARVFAPRRLGVSQAVSLELLPQEYGLSLDPGRHLLLQSRAGLKEHGYTQDERRAGKHGDIKRGKPKASDSQQPG